MVVPVSVCAVRAIETKPLEVTWLSGPRTTLPQPSSFVTRMARPRIREKHLAVSTMSVSYSGLAGGLLGGRLLRGCPLGRLLRCWLVLRLGGLLHGLLGL